MLQGYNESRLKSSFRKFYGRYNDLVCDYKLSLSHMLLCFDYGLTAGVTGQQRMLTPPWHLILPSLLSKVRVALHSILYVFLDYDYVSYFVTSPFYTFILIH